MNVYNVLTAQFAPEGEQFLTFRLGELNYAVPILEVQEIRKWSTPTPMPHSPAHVQGILNLRGAILPVIDLGVRFDQPKRPADSLAVIIVVRVSERPAGLVVDAVNDVVTIPESARRPAPDYEGSAQRDFIQGLAEIDETLLVLLDLRRLIRPEVLVSAMADSPAEPIA